MGAQTPVFVVTMRFVKKWRKKNVVGSDDDRAHLRIGRRHDLNGQAKDLRQSHSFFVNKVIRFIEYFSACFGVSESVKRTGDDVSVVLSRKNYVGHGTENGVGPSSDMFSKNYYQ